MKHCEIMAPASVCCERTNIPEFRNHNLSIFGGDSAVSRIGGGNTARGGLLNHSHTVHTAVRSVSKVSARKAGTGAGLFGRLVRLSGE